MRVEFFNSQTVSLSDDLLAIVDVSGTSGQASLRLFDVQSGKQTAQVDRSQEILSVALSQMPSGRKVAILDKNKDLFVCPSHKADGGAAYAGCHLKCVFLHRGPYVISCQARSGGRSWQCQGDNNRQRGGDRDSEPPLQYVSHIRTLRPRLFVVYLRNNIDSS